jgi:hypothetical protein
MALSASTPIRIVSDFNGPVKFGLLCVGHDRKERLPMSAKIHLSWALSVVLGILDSLREYDLKLEALEVSFEYLLERNHGCSADALWAAYKIVVFLEKYVIEEDRPKVIIAAYIHVSTLSEMAPVLIPVW